MVDLEKVKRDVEGACKSIETAFLALGDKSKEHAEAQRQVDELKAQIAMLQDRKAGYAEDVRAEQQAAAEKKKEHTTKKIKYKKLIEEENLKHAKVFSDNEAEIDNMRMKGMSLLKSEQAKIISENEMVKAETATKIKEYNEYKEKLRKLKEGIPD